MLTHLVVYAREEENINNKKSNKTQGRVEMKENYIHESQRERESEQMPPQQTSSIISISEYSGIDGRGFVSYVQNFLSFVWLFCAVAKSRKGKNKKIFLPSFACVDFVGHSHNAKTFAKIEEKKSLNTQL
jgi:hypothetical protein